MTLNATKCYFVLLQVQNPKVSTSFFKAVGSHEKLWEKSLSDYKVIYLWLPYKGNNSSCILGARGLIKIKAFEKKTHAYWKSWKLRNNESFTIQKCAACALLEDKYGSRNKSPESYTAKRKQHNTFELSKDDNGNVRSTLTPLTYRMLFLQSLFSKTILCISREKCHHDFLQTNVCNFKQCMSSIINLY